TYVLEAGASHLRVLYTFYNPAGFERATLHGTLNDSGGQVEGFHPRLGFGELDFGDVFGQGGPLPLVEYGGVLGPGIAYGIAPIFDDPPGSTTRGVPVPVAGVLVEVYDVKSIGDAL